MRYKVARCRLRELLAERGITQDDLARKIDMKDTQISAYVNYSRTHHVMSLGIAKTIAAAINVSIDDLYEWEKHD